MHSSHQIFREFYLVGWNWGVSFSATLQFNIAGNSLSVYSDFGERGWGGGTYAYWHKNRHHFRLSLALLYNLEIIFKAACLNYESNSKLKWIICEVRHVKYRQEEKDWKFGHKISVHTMLVLVNTCLHFSLMGWVMDIWSQSFLIC